MNSQSTSTDCYMLDGVDSNICFVPPIDLDYDEPNAVVEELNIEFVPAKQFVQTVLLPVAGVLIEKAGKPLVTEHASRTIEQRNAA